MVLTVTKHDENKTISYTSQQKYSFTYLHVQIDVQYNGTRWRVTQRTEILRTQTFWKCRAMHKQARFTTQLSVSCRNETTHVVQKCYRLLLMHMLDHWSIGVGATNKQPTRDQLTFTVK